MRQSPLENRFLESSSDGQTLTVSLRDDWLFGNAADLKQSLEEIGTRAPGAVLFKCGGLQNIDLAGAWILFRKARQFEAVGNKAEFTGFKAAHFKFLDSITRLREKPKLDGTLDRPASLPEALRENLESVGKATAEQLQDVGLIANTVLKGITHPSRLAFRETLRQVDETGFRAVPIVALMGFLMGVVLAYQGATQLTKFGAQIFVVDLVTVAMLREMGVVLAAIMVAGRSGSAFAAALGSMQLNEEVDALRVMGLDPNQVLIAPRIVGLLVAMPLLGVIADVAGLAGGLMLCAVVLDISAMQFISRAGEAAGLTEIMVGLVKAPVFALLIGAVGTLRGLQVEGSAEELGRLTTVAVVQAIFLIILADAVFTVVFAQLGI